MSTSIITDANPGSHSAPGGTQTHALPASLSSGDQNRLAELEASLKRLHSKGFEEGRILRAIREARLYRDQYATFEAYCAERWYYVVRTVQYLIRAAETYDALKAAGVNSLPTSPGQVRSLGSLDLDDQVEVWRVLMGAHGSAQRITRKAVDKVVRTWTQSRKMSKAEQALTSRPLETQKAPVERRGGVRDLVCLGKDAPTAAVDETAEAYEIYGGEDGGLLAPLVGLAAGRPKMSATGAGSAVQSFVAHDDVDLLSATHKTQAAEKAQGAAASLISVGPEAKMRYPARSGKHVAFLGADQKRPLLVSVPRVLVPASLLAGVPDVATEVVIDTTELERLGGPVKGGVVDIDRIREAAREAKIKRVLNRTNEQVDWARYTTNPLTGCWHSCRSTFCYASGIAQRLFPQGFVPTLHPARLDAFANTRLPDVEGVSREQAWRERSVFCVSMGDLFGAWVPAWYIEIVLDEVRQHPDWFVFFLTKHPQRLADFTFSSNCAVGLTITGDEKSMQEGQRSLYASYAEALGNVAGAAFTWISLEPFRGEVYDLAPFFDVGVQMLAMGGQSRTIFAPARQPEMQWVDTVRQQVRRAGVSLFEKENLTVRPKEIPFPEGHPGEHGSLESESPNLALVKAGDPAASAFRVEAA